MSVEEVNQQMNNPSPPPAPNNPSEASPSQSGQNPTHKKAVTAFLVVVVVAVVLAAFWIALNTLSSDQTSPVPTSPKTQEVEIKGDEDLKVLESELSSLDFSDLEKDLAANDQDASKF